MVGISVNVGASPPDTQHVDSVRTRGGYKSRKLKLGGFSWN